MNNMKKKSGLKRLVAYALVLTMVLTLMPTSAFAARQNSLFGWLFQSALSQPKAEPAPAPAEPEAPAEDPAPAEEPEAPAEEPAAEEAPAEEPAEAPAEEPAAVELPAEEAAPAIVEDLVVDDLTVSIDAEPGAFPEGTEVKAEKADLEEVQKAVDEAEDVDGTVLYAVDITFTFRGEELQPAEGKTVKVSFSAPELKDVEDAAVVHIDAETNEAEKVETVEAEDADVAIEAEKFSVYAVVGDGTTSSQDADARRTVNFYSGETLIASMIIRKNDPEEERPKVLYDPGVGELPADKIFRGWTDDPDYDGETEPMNIEEVRTMAYDGIITEGENEVMNFYAVILSAYRIIYFDENENTIHSDVILMRETETVEYKINQSYTSPNPNASFVGWNVLEETAGNVTPEDSSVQAPYPYETVLLVSGDVGLVADVPTGNWLVFESDGGSYVAPQFIVDREGTAYQRVTQKPKDPVKHGYEFLGWFDEDDNAFEFGDTIDERTTIYAKWRQNTTANYAVIIWKQRMTDTYAANRNNKNYDFAEAFIQSGTVGQPITLVSLTGATVTDGDGTQYPNAVVGTTEINSTRNNNMYLGYHCARMDEPGTIQADGSPVVNIYYDRNILTYTFYKYANGPHESYAPAFNDVEPQYGYINGEYVLLTRESGYVYNATTSNSGTQYGLVDGEYVELHQASRDVYTGNNPTSGTVYGLVDGEYVVLTSQDVYQYVSTTSNSTSPTQYGYQNGEYFELERHGLLGAYWWTRAGSGAFGGRYTGTRYTYNYIRTDWYYNGALYSDTRYSKSTQQFWAYGDDDTEYTGTRYTRDSAYLWYYEGEPYTMQRYTLSSSTGAGWAIDQNEVGYYGEELNWPEDTTYWWYPTGNNNGTASGTRMTYKNDFLPLDSNMNVSYYGVQETGTATIEFQTQDYPDTSSYTTQATVTTDANQFNINDKFAGYKAYQYRTNGSGSWTNVGTLNPSTGIYGSAVRFNTKLEVRYNRKMSDIVYMDGTYFDDKNGTVPSDTAVASTEAFGTVPNVLFGADITAYKDGPIRQEGDEDPFPTPYNEGYTFVGWYADKTCTVPYTFGTMPDGGLTVYAKWVKTGYRVFLHANAYIEDDDGNLQLDGSLDWGGNQAMNFYVEYGGSVQNVVGTRTEYEFVGWFRDEALRDPFSVEDIKLSDDTVPATPAYNKSVDMTDDMDIYGNIINPTTASNSDVERPWVQRKLNLYAKWRHILIGAKGINVEYDVGDSDSNIFDSLYYLDGTWVFAQNAPTPNDTNKRFLHWEILKWSDGEEEEPEEPGEGEGEEAGEGEFVATGATVYPGDTFEVLLKNAKVEELEGSTPEDPKYKYTVMLRAVYTDKEVPTNTHIDWYGNGGKTADNETVVKDTGLQINQAVAVRPATTFTLENAEFIGWARVNEGTEPTAETKPWLYWDGTNFHEDAIDGTIVTKVAADEVTPYHDLYALWDEVFYVVPVIDGVDQDTITCHFSELDANGKYNLLQHVSADCLYGGYQIVQNEARAYQTVRGDAIEPVAGETYYIKEVSKSRNYLDCKMQSLRKKNTLRVTDVYVFSSIDDLYYKETGFIVGLTTKKATGIRTSYTVWTSDRSASVTINRTKFGGQAENDGYITYTDLHGTDLVDGSYSFIPYWLTFDNIEVRGVTNKHFSISNGILTNGECEAITAVAAYREPDSE